MNFGFSGEMIFLFFLALILFGPKKLPEIARQVGRFMNEFRRASSEFRSQVESEINSFETGGRPQILPPAQAPLGSLASRIFSPPPAERLKAAEAETAPDPQPAPEPAPKPEPLPTPKVAPDA